MGPGLVTGDIFGFSVESLGDLDGDGVQDLAVGAPLSDYGGQVNQGMVWILFLNTDGTVKATQRIAEGLGGFTDSLQRYDYLGSNLATLGDLDGDGVQDLAVSAYRYGANGNSWSDGYGGIWILFLNTDGTVKSYQKISATSGGFTGDFGNADLFGHGISSIGDINADGVIDLAVGAPWSDEGGNFRGAVWILMLNTVGTVESHLKIGNYTGGFGGALDYGDNFGIDVSSLGDLDGDGLLDLVVCANGDDDGGGDRGAVWLVELAAPPRVQSIVASDMNPTSATVVRYAVAFTESVSGVGAGDFAVAGDIGSAGVLLVTENTPSGYTVEVDGGTGEGWLRLDLADNDSILSTGTLLALGMPGAGNGDAQGETYVFDRTRPASQVTAPTGVTTRTLVNVSWISNDDAGTSPSGVAAVEIYWTYDDGPVYRFMGSHPVGTDTTAFTLPWGTGDYSFYSVAVDNVGNREDAPPSPDVVLTLVPSGVSRARHWPLYE